MLNVREPSPVGGAHDLQPARPHVHRILALPRLALLLITVATLAIASNAQGARIVDWSLEGYPLDGKGSLNDTLRMVLTPLQPDVLTLEEIETQVSVDSFRTAILNRINPVEWAAAPYVVGNDSNNELFYRTTKFQLLGSWSFYPNQPTNSRLCDVYRMKPVGYASAAVEVRFYVVHLKSGNTTSDNAARVVETTTIRDSMNHMPAGTHAILVGDFNIENNSSTQGLQKLVQSQSNNTGRLVDLLNPTNVSQSWTYNSAFANVHSLCPCLTPGVDCPSRFAGDGMRDRFDFFMPTLNLHDAAGLELLTATYVTVGNDGQHFEKNLSASPAIPEGRPYANLLQHASEHVPIRIDLQLPPRLGVVSAFDLGTVIVGGGVPIAITNIAMAPAAPLHYSLAATTGFSAPGSSFTLATGPGALHTISTTAGSAGNRSGTLTITSDDPDHATLNVGLTAKVLDHAAASLDAATSVTAQTLDFGDHEAGAFTDQVVNVYDRGYNSLRAQLSLDGAVFGGGAGRFSIVGGFAPVLVAGTPKAESIHFDASGATTDSTYQATLTFHSSDEPLPGAASQPDLVVTLRARVLTGAADVPTGGARAFTRLEPPFPNPLDGGCTIRFQLAREGMMSLEVLDLAGRRVASLDHGLRSPGAYSIRWAGRDDRGVPAATGLYFLRLTGPRGDVHASRLVIAR